MVAKFTYMYLIKINRVTVGQYSRPIHSILAWYWIQIHGSAMASLRDQPRFVSGYDHPHS